MWSKFYKNHLISTRTLFFTSTVNKFFVCFHFCVQICSWRENLTKKCLKSCSQAIFIMTFVRLQPPLFPWQPSTGVFIWCIMKPRVPSHTLRDNKALCISVWWFYACHCWHQVDFYLVKMKQEKLDLQPSLKWLWKFYVWHWRFLKLCFLLKMGGRTWITKKKKLALECLSLKASDHSFISTIWPIGRVKFLPTYLIIILLAAKNRGYFYLLVYLCKISKQLCG